MDLPDWLRGLLGLAPPDPPSPLVREVLRLLISDRSSWRRVPYRLIHDKSGVAIWTGNEEYGLHLETGLDRFGYGIRIDLTKAERHAIFKAAQWEKFDRANATWSMAAH